MKSSLMSARHEDVSLIDVEGIIRVARQHKVQMALSAGLVAVATAALFFTQKPTYQAEAIVALNRSDNPVVVDPATRQTQQVLTDSADVDTEVQIIKSPSILKSVVRRMKLTRDPAFVAAAKPEDVTVALVSDMLAENLAVERKGTSYAIRIAYTADNPQFAATMANSIASSYVDSQITTKAEGRSEGIAMLSKRLKQLRNDVLSAEAAVSQYRSDHGLVGIVGGTDNSGVQQQQLANLNGELAQAQADLAGAAAQARINSNTSGSLVNNSATIANLRVRHAELVAKQGELAQQFGPRYHERQAVESELAAIDDALSREMGRVSSGARGDAQSARERVSAIQSAIARTHGDLLKANATSVRLNELERVAESSRQLYQAFLDRYRVELATKGTEKGRAYIVSSAAVPYQPASPNALAYALGGLIAAFAMAGLVAMLLEWRERGFRTRAEVEKSLGVPVLSSIPDLATVRGVRFKGDTPLALANYLVENDGSLFNEGFRSIRTELKLGQPGQLAKVLAVTSAVADEGKTTTAICLARSAAMAGFRTLLIDADVRRHASTRSLASTVQAGLLDVVTGEASLADAMLFDEVSGAYVLPQVRGAPGASDVVQSSAMSDLLEQLAQSFDFIVLDTAPVLPVAETRALAAMADATMLVLRWRMTSEVNALAAVGQLERAGANLLGVVLTKVDVQATAALSDDVAHYQAYQEVEPSPFPA